MHYLFPIADCRSRAGDCNLELRLTSPPSTHETAYRLTGTVHVRCAPQPPGPDSQPATCNLQAALAEGGSVRICALATGLTEEAFLDAQGMFCQELELHPDADNALELAVCDSAGRELVRLPARVRHRPHGQPLDPEVVLALIPTVPPGADPFNGPGILKQDEDRARQLGRELKVYSARSLSGPDLVQLAHEGQYDLIILPLPMVTVGGTSTALDDRTAYVLSHAHCRVFLAAAPVIPQEVIDTAPSPPDAAAGPGSPAPA